MGRPAGSRLWEGVSLKVSELSCQCLQWMLPARAIARREWMCTKCDLRISVASVSLTSLVLAVPSAFAWLADVVEDIQPKLVVNVLNIRMVSSAFWDKCRRPLSIR